MELRALASEARPVQALELFGHGLLDRVAAAGERFGAHQPVQALEQVTLDSDRDLVTRHGMTIRHTGAVLQVRWAGHHANDALRRRVIGTGSSRTARNRARGDLSPRYPPF